MNIDNIMDELIDSYNLEDISKAYQKACDRAATKAKNKEITDARSKVLAALTQYFIAVFGKVDKDLVKEFENELITIEREFAESSDEPVKKVKTVKIDDATDDEKLRKFLEDLFKY